MDMASDFGSEDCGFESRRGQMFLSLESYRVGGNKLLLANCFLADRTPLKATSRERNRETESFPSYCTEMHCIEEFLRQVSGIMNLFFRLSVSKNLTVHLLRAVRKRLKT